MAITTRPADISDLGAIADLLLTDAKARCALDPGLWSLVRDPATAIASAVRASMDAEAPPFRQQWLVAQAGQAIVGVTHSILLPVPPIYAAAFGPPGLIMEDCHVATGAPPETRRRLLTAAEDDLVKAGARVLLASSVEGGEWASEYARQGFAPLTMYFAKAGLCQARPRADVRPATPDDVPGLVASSAINREILERLAPRFWQPHDAADDRFAAWMRRSLTLTDRDMFVSDVGGKIQGYAISQPATRLHFPAAHDISDVGVIDDFFHDQMRNPQSLEAEGSGAAALFNAAEAARDSRGDNAILVVCPAAWTSKRTLLAQSGYSNAITWLIKMAG